MAQWITNTSVGNPVKRRPAGSSLYDEIVDIFLAP